MSKKRKPPKPPADTPQTPIEPEVSSAPEAQFSDKLSPVMGCPPNVLDRSRIELYGGLILGVILQAVPMSAFTRSLFFLIVLAAFIDVVWRSAWTHYRKRSSKVITTGILSILYLALVAGMFFRESESFRLAVLAALGSQKFFYFLFFVAGTITAVLGAKGTSLVKGYLQSQKAERAAIRESFQATPKGWLDHRVESEESSQQLHVMTARFLQPLGGAAKAVVIANWVFHKKRNKTLGGARVWAYFIASAINASTAKMETCIDELRLTADRFTESTEGHLKVCKQNYGKLDAARQYFEVQLKEIRESVYEMRKLPPVVAQFKGVSQDLDAAMNRQATCFRSYAEILRKLEGHCARMIKLTEARRDRALVKPLKKLASSLEEIVDQMSKDKSATETAQE